jgi:hypothetical protein
MPDLWETPWLYSTIQTLPELLPGTGIARQDPWGRQSELVKAFFAGS